MKDIETLSALFDNKVLAVLAVLVNDNTNGLYMREISKFANVPDSTTFRIIQKLIKSNLLDTTAIKNLKLYKIKKDESTELLFKMLKKEVRVLDIFIKRLREQMSLDLVILYGEETNQRSNVLLIGDVINPEKVKEMVGEIKMTHNFVINHTILTNEQYESLSKMGQFSGKKQVLFKRGGEQAQQAAATQQQAQPANAPK